MSKLRVGIVESLVPSCVPLDSEILTQRGWLLHDQVRIGDQTLGVNPQTRQTEWTTIRQVIHNPLESVLRVGNDYWSARATSNHRWPIWLGDEQFFLTTEELPGWRGSRQRRNGTIEVAEVVTRAPFVGGTSALTPREAAILAWLYTDGSVRQRRTAAVRRVKGGSMEFAISQSKQKGVTALRALLSSVPHSESAPRFRLSSVYGRTLWEKAGLCDGRTLMEVVLSLSRPALEAFMEAAFLAEGSWMTPKLQILYQNVGPTLDALALGAYLLGFRPRVHVHDSQTSLSPLRGQCRKVHCCESKIRRRGLRVERLGAKPTWCVTTDLGTWTMRQDEQILITGNCDLYRAQGPAEVLATSGEIEVVKLPNEITVRYANRQHGPMQMVGIKDFPEDLDVIVFVRGVLPARIAQIIPLLQDKGIAVVVDVDDDYERLPTALMDLYKINPTLNPLYNWKQVKKACRMADMVTCSTPALQRYGPHGRVAVLRNSIPVRYIRVGERIAPARTGNTVGWAGVIAGHPGDLRVPRAGVAEALDRTGAKFLNVGDGVGIKEQLGLSEDPEVSGVVPLAEYPDFIALFDVGIAPLTMNAYSIAKCLDVDTKILTCSGVRRIADVREGDLVWGGGWHQVLATERRAEAVPGLLIETELGLRLKLTANHRLRSGDWRAAGELQIGDELDLDPEDWPVDLPYVRVPWPAESRMSRRADHDPQGFISAPLGPTLEIEERWGRFLGLYAGDGSSGYGGAVNFSMDGQDADLIELLMADIRAIGLHASTESEKTTWDGHVLRRRSIRVSSSALGRVMESIGCVVRKTAGGTRRIICVPPLIWSSPRSVVSAFLSGLFEADGTVGQSSVSFVTKDEKLAQDVQRLLVGFGIFAKLFGKPGPKNVKGRDYSDRTYWKVDLGFAGTVIFAREIGMLSERKKAKLAVIAARADRILNSQVPYGECHCGCGSRTRIARQADRHGNRKGEPKRYLKGHAPKTSVLRVPVRDAITRIGPCLLQPVDLQVVGERFGAAGIVSHNSALKPLESLSVGSCVVATPTPEYQRLQEELAEWCRASGQPCPMVTAKSDRREWRDGLVRFLEAVERSGDELAAAGREFVQERYLMQRRAEQWGEAWEQAVKNRKGAKAHGQQVRAVTRTVRVRH